MAAPQYVTASTGTTDATGAWTHTSAAPSAAGNILIVQALQDGTLADISITSVTNAENLAGTDNVLTSIGEFAVGSAVAASQHLWIGRALSTSAMVITGANAGGDDVYVRVYEFRDVNTGTTLADVIENGTAGATTNSAGTGTVVSDAAVTTLGVDRLPLNFVAENDDTLTTTSFTGETGGDWRTAAAVYAEAGGTDGSLLLQMGQMGTLASYNAANTTVTTIQGAPGTGEKGAASFQSGAGGTVTSVQVKLGKNNSPTDDVTCEIWSDSAGQPSAIVGTGGSVSGTELDAVGKAITFSVSATLAASTTYYVVIGRSGARDTTNNYEMMGANPGAYAGGEHHERSSSVWATSGTGDTAFGLSAGAGTIDGGTATFASAAWGCVGFALIGTTVVVTDVRPPPHRVISDAAIQRASLW